MLADAQSAGRGRLGRPWASPAGAGIYVSAVLRPPPQAMALLTMAAGLGVSEGIAAATGLQTHVKRPNDVVRAGRPPRKLAGLLAEARSSATACSRRARDRHQRACRRPIRPTWLRARRRSSELGRAVSRAGGARRVPGGRVAALRDADCSGRWRRRAGGVARAGRRHLRPPCGVGRAGRTAPRDRPRRGRASGALIVAGETGWCA